MSEDLKPEGIRTLLLGPMILLGELMGALIPGVIFVLLLIVKRVPEAMSAINCGFIGYKTKIVCGVLISFVVGKLFFIPVSALENHLLKLDDDVRCSEARFDHSEVDAAWKEASWWHNQFEGPGRSHGVGTLHSRTVRSCVSSFDGIGFDSRLVRSGRRTAASCRDLAGLIFICGGRSLCQEFIQASSSSS